MYKLLLPLTVWYWGCESASVKIETETEALDSQTQADGAESSDTQEDDPDLSLDDEDADAQEETDSNDSLVELQQQLEEDCENGEARACDMLQELLALEEECAQGNEGACARLAQMIEMFEDRPDESGPDDWGEESWEEEEWDPGSYEATLEVYRGNGAVMCSSEIEVTITNSEMTGETSCETRMGHTFAFELMATLSSTQSSGTMTVIDPRGVSVAAEVDGTCYNAEGALAFDAFWTATLETPSGQQIEQQGMVYYIE